jgi:hypothetical protein
VHPLLALFTLISRGQGNRSVGRLSALGQRSIVLIVIIIIIIFSIVIIISVSVLMALSLVPAL